MNRTGPGDERIIEMCSTLFEEKDGHVEYLTLCFANVHVEIDNAQSARVLQRLVQ